MGKKRAPGTQFDVLFVGAGVSTLYTVLNLLHRPRQGRALRIGVVERCPDGFGGLPYGSRSSYHSLLITSLRHFLPEPEKALFIEWLNQNKDSAFELLKRDGGELSAQWLESHAAAIAANHWDELYLPRYLFGLFMEARVRKAIAAAASAGVCKFQLIRGEATALRRLDRVFEIEVAEIGRPLRSSAVVLAIGSPPNLPRLPSSEKFDGNDLCLIDDPYDPSLTTNLRKVEMFVHAAKAPVQILFLGGAASTMDVLYTLNDRLGLSSRDVTFQVLSPCGKLPDRLMDQQAPFRPVTLESLPQNGGITARKIYDAAVNDIRMGEADGRTTSDTLAPISAAMDALVANLSLDEKREFAATWGATLGRLQRRAGPEYSDVAAALVAQERLAVIEGRFVGAVSVNAHGAQIEYVSRGQHQLLPGRSNVLINCGGFARIQELPEKHLIRGILASGLAQATPAGTGLVVDDQMDAGNGLFVLGPLLAGNVIAGTPIWHLEHCGRISAFAKALAGILEARLAGENALAKP